jgi:hypothetical protein
MSRQQQIHLRFSRRFAATCLLISSGFVLGGCSPGAGSGSSGNNITVSITNKITSIQAGTAGLTFMATVQNDSTNSGVTWSLTANGVACSPACGTLSSATTTAVTYTPPVSGPAAPSNQPNLTATSVAKANKTDADSFLITAALKVSVANKFASVNAGFSPFVVNATVQNDPTNSGVTWTLMSNGASCSPGCGVLSGLTPTSVTYAPPKSVPAAQPTLTAISVHDSSKSDFDSFTIQQPSIVVAIQNKITTAVASAPGIFLSASVQNDSSTNPSITWKLMVNGADCQPLCGTLSAAGSESIVYNPPALVPAAPNNQPTLTASSNTDPTKLDSDVFTITAKPPIAVTITQISSIVANATGGVNFSANVQNDFSNPPQGVTWALAAGGSACSPACGSLSNMQALSVTYTPPTSVPASPNNQPTLTATSVADSTKASSDTFTIAPTVANGCGSAGGGESLLNGHYAFLMEGFSGTTGLPYFVAGSFVGNGSGAITGGDEDVNDTISPQHLTVTSNGSLYTVGADHRGCLQLTNTGGTTAIFHFALGGISGGFASKGSIIEFDDNSGAGSRGSGLLRLQDPNSFALSAMQTGYAFGVDGWATQDDQLFRMSAAGSFSDSNGGLTNGVDDLNFAGSLSVDATGLTGMINPVSASGRTTGTFDIFDWAIYVINSSEFFFVGTDPLSNGNISIGRAISAGNSFSASSLSGSYVVHATGNTNGSADVNLDLLAATPGGAQTGTLSGTVYSYGAANGGQATNLSGVTYNVDPTSGRTTLGNPGDNLPILYVTTPTDGIAAFVVGIAPDALSGLAEPQTSAALSAGTYLFGSEIVADNTVTNKAGIETISSGGAVSGTYDQSNTSGLLTGQAVSAALSLGSNGAGNIGPNTVAITSGNKVFSINESGGTSGPAVITVAEQ